MSVTVYGERGCQGAVAPADRIMTTAIRSEVPEYISAHVQR